MQESIMYAEKFKRSEADGDTHNGRAVLLGRRRR